MKALFQSKFNRIFLQAWMILLAGVFFTATAQAQTGPVVTTNPSSVSVNSGSTATFTAAASGTPTPTVQWQVSTDGGSSYINVAGATTTTLSFTASSGYNGNKYRAVFTNASGSATTTAATLTVNYAPSVTTNPVSHSVSAGSTATFTAAASGNPTPTVQWQLSSNGGGSFVNMAGATSTTLSFTTQAGDNGNQYRAVFTNPSGSAATTAASLTVTAGPVVTTNPSSLTVNNGSVATFTAAASGTPTPTVQWQVSTDGGATYANIAGATTTTLTFNASSSQNGNKYRAVFTNASGSATTTAATLTVNYAPSVTTNPVSQSVSAGSTATFTAAASGNPTPTVQWQVSTDGGATFANVAGATSTTLSFTTQAGNNGNQYRAVFTDSVGSATTTAASLTVTAGPVVTTNPSSVSVNSGSVATFTAAATGTPTPTVQWQVSTDGGATFVNIAGATTTTLNFTASSSQNGNKYRAVFTNASGSATTTAATLTVNYAPSVTTNPVSQSVSAGSTAIFTAAASGNPTPTVQWQLSSNGGGSFVNIAGATSTTLSFTTQVANNGNQYRAVFTDSVGSATTTAASLTVTAGPVVTTNPSSVSVNSGSVATFTAAATGTPTPTVQWQVSTDGGATFVNIAGATTTTLNFTASSSQNGNKYRAVFTNASGSATTTAATLTVTTGPSVTPKFTKLTVSGINLNLAGTNVVAGTYVLVTSTNLTTAAAQWTPVLTNTFAATTSFNVIVPNEFSPSIARKFYRYRTP